MASLLLTTAPGAMLPGMPVVSPGGAAPTVDFLDLLMPSADVATAIPGGTRQDVAAMPGTTLPTMPAAAAPAGEDALAWLENATGVVVPPAPPVVAAPVAIETPAPVAVPMKRAPADLIAPPIIEPVMVPDDLVPAAPDIDTTTPTPTDDDDAAPKDAASDAPATLVSAQPQLAAAPPPVDVPVAPRHAKAEACGKAASVDTTTDAVTTAPAASQPVAPAPLAAIPQPAAEAAPVTVTPPVAHDAAPGARAASRRSATIAPTLAVTPAAGPAPAPVVAAVTTPVVTSPDIASMPAPEPSARAVPPTTTATVPTDAPAVIISAAETPSEAQPAPVTARIRTGVRPDAPTRQPMAVDQVVTASGDTPIAAMPPRAASRGPVVIDRAGAQAIAADAQSVPTPADPARPVIAAAAPLRVDTAMPLDVAPVRADVAVPLAAAPVTATPVRAGATIPSVAVPARADAVAPPTATPVRAGAAIPPAAAPVRADTVAPLTATPVRADAAIPLATPSPSVVPAVPLAAIPIVTPVTPVGVAPAATPSLVETPVAATPTTDEAPTRTAAVATPAPAPVSSAPVIASAARTFADAIHRAVTGEERGRAADPTGAAPATAPVGTITAAAVAAPAQAGQQTLDMRQPHWPETMIQRIEMLRDMADANDMRIRVVPDALGAIDVSLRRDGDTVQVQLTAEQPQTRAMLAEAQPRLTDMAEARGLKLTQAGGGTGASGQNADRQPSSQQQRPAPVPAAPPSARRPAEVADDTDQLIA